MGTLDLRRLWDGRLPVRFALAEAISVPVPERERAGVVLVVRRRGLGRGGPSGRRGGPVVVARGTEGGSGPES